MSDSITLADFEGTSRQIQVGEFVSFKYDVEQVGEVLRVDERRRSITVWATEGDYAGDGAEVELLAGDFWLDR